MIFTDISDVGRGFFSSPLLEGAVDLVGAVEVGAVTEAGTAACSFSVDGLVYFFARLRLAAAGGAAWGARGGIGASGGWTFGGINNCAIAICC